MSTDKKQKTMDELIENMFGAFRPVSDTKKYVMRTDENGVEFVFNAVGHNKKTINLEVINNKLQIVSTQEREYPFMNDINYIYNLEENHDVDNITADCKDGILVIRIGLKEPEKPESRKITVK